MSDPAFDGPIWDVKTAYYETAQVLRDVLAEADSALSNRLRTRIVDTISQLDRKYRVAPKAKVRK